jgi:hypothetical protein
MLTSASSLSRMAAWWPTSDEVFAALLQTFIDHGIRPRPAQRAALKCRGWILGCPSAGPSQALLTLVLSEPRALSFQRAGYWAYLL